MTALPLPSTPVRLLTVADYTSLPDLAVVKREAFHPLGRRRATGR
jgi:hypothetical protein